MRALTLIGLLHTGGAFAHGGLPETLDRVVSDSGETLVTTHGFLQDSGGSWEWVCEEIIGAYAFRTGFQITPLGTWILSTTSGILTSEDGCSWAYAEGPFAYVSQLALDPVDPGVIWVATDEGLWRSADDGSTFALDLPVDASLRSFVQTADGFYLWVFDGDQPQVWFGDADGFDKTPIEVSAGQLLGLEADEEGRAYARFPAGAADELRRYSPDGTEEILLQTVVNLSAFDIGADGTLHASVRGLGTQVSTDDGATWTAPDGQPVNCLHGDVSCPDLNTGVEALFDGGGEVSLRFADVAGPRDCPADSDFALYCEPLWPLVSLQFGLEEGSEDTGTPSVEVESSCGCNQAPGALWFGWILPALLATRRR